MLLQLLLQDAAGLDEQAAIDRLVRHLVSLVVRDRCASATRQSAPATSSHEAWQRPAAATHHASPACTPSAAVRDPRPACPQRQRDTAADRRCAQLAADRRGARPSCAAIDRSERPATPREISSRSSRLSTRRDRRRGAGRMPPCGFRCAKIATMSCQTPGRSASALRPAANDPKPRRSPPQ